MANPLPLLPAEEYIEQRYFFAAFRERLADQQPAQEILRQLGDELLATTRLALAVQFMLDELKHSGALSAAFAKLPHYFTAFQTHVVRQAEVDSSRFTFTQALLILEREAHYRSCTPTPAGLFIYQLEAISRNNLGFAAGLAALQRDGFYNEHWRHYFGIVSQQLGMRDIAELIFARSEQYVAERRRYERDYAPPFEPLFGVKEGRIAAANRGKDPMFLFAALQRQLGYPEVPRPPKEDPTRHELEELLRKVTALETRLTLLEAQTTGNVDLSQFYVKRE